MHQILLFALFMVIVVGCMFFALVAPGGSVY
jgi:hypothetical protein